MAETKLSKISSDSVRSILNETIEKHLNTNDFDVNVSSGANADDNFLGIVQRITYNKIADKNEDAQKSTLFLKTAPTNAIRREGFNSRNCFLREIYVYDEVLPYFRKFQESKGISADDIFNEYPKSYRTSDEEPNECLLLEDLTSTDFSMINRRKENVTVDHVNLIMKSLGKFNAISFALRDQQPDKFKEFTSNIPDTMYSNAKPEMIGFFEMMKSSVYESVENDANLIERLDKMYTKTQIEIFGECIDGAAAEPYAVIAHGDFWTNNMMFKYDGNHKPIEVCLIDWQLMRYASPVIDLLHFLFGCITNELRDGNYESFLKTYHESLSNHLKRLGSDPEKLFPYDAMLDQFRKFGKYGVVTASLLLPRMTSNEVQNLDLDDFAQQLHEHREIDVNLLLPTDSRALSQKCLRGVVDDMVRLNYL